jgi:CBS domain-containing protein
MVAPRRCLTARRNESPLAENKTMTLNPYHPLRQHPLAEGTTCRVAGAVPQMVRADSPAIAVMTDLTQVSAATIGPDATLADATRLMIARGVRLLLVVDHYQVIQGVITAHDTMGERPINLLHDRGGRHRELHVADLMTERPAMQVLDMADVLRAEVGHIVATLKNCARQHALVVERDRMTGDDYVRGIFSATQIGRQLGVAIPIFEVANSFAEIEAALVA